MAMTMKIISKERIKPSSPTPHSQKSYKLSVLDQTAEKSFVPIVVFYSKSADHRKNETTFEHKIENLKTSLSKTLTLMYPFAGRIADKFSIDCNDQGADFVLAHVDEDMSNVVQLPKKEALRQLLPPCDHDQLLAAVQVNGFSDGGIAIGISLSHIVGDASTVATFLKTWATLNHKGTDPCSLENGFVVDRPAIFTPVEHPFSLSDMAPLDRKTKAKRFLFSEANIYALRAKADQVRVSSPPTRFEAVAAALWAAVIAARKDLNKGMDMEMMICIVDIRKRLEPTFPPNSIGNILHFAWAPWMATEGTIDYSSFTKRIHDSIRGVTNDHVRKIHENSGYMNVLKSTGEALGNSTKVGNFVVNSWCRFPFYEADFGWGKPRWVGSPVVIPDSALLIDSVDGKGIEALVELEEDEMVRLEQNAEFNAFVSFSQTF